MSKGLKVVCSLLPSPETCLQNEKIIISILQKEKEMKSLAEPVFWFAFYCFDSSITILQFIHEYVPELKQ